LHRLLNFENIVAGVYPRLVVYEKYSLNGNESRQEKISTFGAKHLQATAPLFYPYNTPICRVEETLQN
jgi:hypothetical protein